MVINTSAAWICSAAQKSALHVADRNERACNVEIWNSRMEVMRRIILKNRIPYAVAFVNTVLEKYQKNKTEWAI